ncbi:hypothetical protein ACWEO4_36865 [Streptomyces sp. NPDC004393]
MTKPDGPGPGAAADLDEVIIHGALLDITVEVVRRNPDDQGKDFVPQPKR